MGVLLSQEKIGHLVLKNIACLHHPFGKYLVLMQSQKCYHVGDFLGQLIKGHGQVFNVQINACHQFKPMAMVSVSSFVSSRYMEHYSCC